MNDTLAGRLVCGLCLESVADCLGSVARLLGICSRLLGICSTTPFGSALKTLFLLSFSMVGKALKNKY